MALSTSHKVSIFVCSLVLSACGGGGGGSDSRDDDTRPVVSSTSPGADANNVIRAALVKAQFNEDILATSVSQESLKLTGNAGNIAGQLEFDGVSNAIVFRPDERLPMGTQLTASLSQDITDLSGNTLGNQYSWSFTTSNGGWTGPVSIEDSTPHADSPEVAYDAEGNAIAVWIQANNTRYNTYANRYSAVDGTWGDPILIQADERGNSYSPQVAFDADGNALAVWSQHDDDQRNIYANRYSAEDGKWEGAELIESGDGYADIPQIAIDRDGNAVVVWYQQDIPKSSIYANRYSAEEKRWGKATLLENNYSGDADEPQVVFNNTGDAFVVWEQNDGTRFNIFVNKYSADEGTWGTAEFLELDNAGDARHPQLTTDGDNIVAVWQQFDGLHTNIYATRYSSEDQLWGAVTLLEESDSGDAQNPQVEFDSNGDAMAVWAQDDGAHINIYANRFSTSDNKWLGVIPIEVGNEGDSSSPQLATDGDGNTIVVWKNDDGSGMTNIWANRYTLEADKWEGAVLIENDDSGQAVAPQIAVASRGEAIVVWMQYSGGLKNIMANHYD